MGRMRAAVDRKLGRATSPADLTGATREKRVIHGREVLVTVLPTQQHNAWSLNERVDAAMPDASLARVAGTGRSRRHPGSA